MTTVLIVEDEFLIAKVLTKGLEGFGLQVCGIASTGEKAIDLAMEHKPDLVLLDICLAGRMDGIEAGLAIKQQIDTQFLIVTGNPTAELSERVAPLDPISVLPKPYRMATIASLISSWLEAVG